MITPVGILKSTKTEKFHPIVFRRAPMPGGADDNMYAQRYRSMGHHTEGFDTLEAAQAYIEEQSGWKDCGAVWAWDEEEVPTMTEWFSSSKGG
jgi:hypothetical protein